MVPPPPQLQPRWQLAAEESSSQQQPGGRRWRGELPHLSAHFFAPPRAVLPEHVLLPITSKREDNEEDAGIPRVLPKWQGILVRNNDTSGLKDEEATLHDSMDALGVASAAPPSPGAAMHWVTTPDRRPCTLPEEKEAMVSHAPSSSLGREYVTVPDGAVLQAQYPHLLAPPCSSTTT